MRGETVASFWPQGQVCLGHTSQGTAINAFGYPGRGDGRVLVIAGVHGSERSGVEVADRLNAMLQSQYGYTPEPNTVLVPALFPDNVAARLREGDVPTNRNFPAPGEGLETARRKGDGSPVDSLGVPLLPENQALLALVARFQPQMIISVHATVHPERAGIFADPHRLPVSMDETGRQAQAEIAAERTARDAALAIRLARAAAARGVSMSGNRLEGEPTALWSGESPEGTSLGGWGPCPVVDGSAEDRDAIGVITIEVDGIAPSDEAVDPVIRRAEVTALAEVIFDEALNRWPPVD